MKHECAARGCTKKIPRRMLMCAEHWRKVPHKERTKVWDTYRPGQESQGEITPEYIDAAQGAIDAVALKEGVA
jgi:hypothetical protein